MTVEQSARRARSRSRRAGVFGLALAGGLVVSLLGALAGAASASPATSPQRARPASTAAILPMAPAPRPSAARLRQALAGLEATSANGWVQSKSYGGTSPWAVSCVTGTTTCVSLSDPNSPTAYVTTDGSTWTGHALPLLNMGTGAGVSCPTTSDCWITDGNSPPAVATTSDGGSAWTPESPPDWATDNWILDGIDCPSTTVCYAAGGSSSGAAKPVVAKLTNGTWSLLTSFPAGSYLLSAISCASATSCTAVGGTGGAAAAVVETTDGGKDWTRSTDGLLGNYLPFSSVSCAAAADCWATTGPPGKAGTSVLVTSNRGLAWSVTAVGAAEDLTGIDCIGQHVSTTSCWAAGESFTSGSGEAVATVDGGRHWYAQSMPTSSPYIGAVSCASSEDCWATSGGLVFSTTDGGHAAPRGTSRTVLASYPAKPMVGQTTFLLALVSDAGGQQPVDDVEFTYFGTPISFCSDVAVSHLSNGQSYAVCSLFWTVPGTFSIGASYSGDYYAGPSTGSASVPAHRPAYRFVAADGGIFSFGGLGFDGSVPGVHVATESVVGMAPDLDTGGYWVASSNGGIFSFGAHFYGSAAGHLTAPIVGIAATNDALGYWLVGRDGNVYSFGDAYDAGRVVGVPASDPIVGIAAGPLGGYWLVGRDGDVYAFGGAAKEGSLQPGEASNIVGIAANAGGNGYWLAGANGGVYAFGAARYLGSMGAVHLTKPIVGLAADPATGGYWLVGADGGIFSFRAPFDGSTGNIKLSQPIVGMTAG